MDLSNQSDYAYMMFLVSSYRIFHILWDGFGDWDLGDDIIFPAQQFWKMTSQNGIIPEDDLPRNEQIPEDDLPRMAKSRLKTSRNWPGPGTSITVIRRHLQVNLLPVQSKVIFRSRTIPACRMPELMEIFKFTCLWLKTAGNSLWLGKDIQVILRLLKMVLC